MKKNDLGNIKVHWEKIEQAPGLHPHEVDIFPRFVAHAEIAEKILEIGVGDGRMQQNLVDAGINVQKLYGIDIGEHIWKSLGHKFIGDARNLEFSDDTFDLVYSLGVVEHFHETQQAINEHFRVLKPGGHALVTTPRLSFETLYRKYSFYRNTLQKKGTFKEIKGENFSLNHLSKILKNAGFKVIYQNADGDVSTYIKRKSPKFYHRYLMRHKNNFGSFNVIYAQKPQ
jgi:ubiquinone/menaquinone biosynthesis C-methylase UbiE